VKTRRARQDSRTPEQIREHYEVERALADRLRRAGREERRTLYRSLYDELFQRLPQHPMLTRKVSQADSDRHVEQQIKFLGRYLFDTAAFMEVGPGDCALSFAVARDVREVFAVDVSDEISRRATFPANLHLLLSDGCTIPLPSSSIDVAYSNQLMEHLHPDDALEQLHGIYDALVPGGMYVCITPNRLTGPHDISRDFDETATGFHLKEYTVSELRTLFDVAGFRRVHFYVGGRGHFQRCPEVVLRSCERWLGRLSPASAKRLGRRPPLRALVNVVRVVGTK
jgi:SAM-dependent methyltransferase